MYSLNFDGIAMGLKAATRSSHLSYKLRILRTIIRLINSNVCTFSEVCLKSAAVAIMAEADIFKDLTWIISHSFRGFILSTVD